MASEVTVTTALEGEPSAARQGFALPLFLTRENKYTVGFVMWILATLLYMTANHFPILTPRHLPLWWVDRAIPLIPETIWIYVSEYLFFIAIYVSAKDMVNTNKYLYSVFALQFFSVLIFWFWPTVYPREFFPLPEDIDALTFFMFTWIRTIDAPTNCCPSLHVSSVFLSTFIFLDEQRKKFPFFFLWGTAIAASTLPTKQHYLVDVITGFLLAVIFYWIFHRLMAYRPGARAAQPNR